MGFVKTILKGVITCGRPTAKFCKAPVLSAKTLTIRNSSKVVGRQRATFASFETGKLRNWIGMKNLPENGQHFPGFEPVISRMEK